MLDDNQNEPEQRSLNPDENNDTLSDSASLTRAAALKEGTRIHRYQILGLVGEGGMGSVYKAYDPELDRSIAIKMLNVEPQQGETLSSPQARLMREAQALAKLNHPNVVAVHDVGTYKDGVYIAMEYVKGKTLREWIRDEHPTQKQMIEVLIKAGEGLQSAHAEGIVHRDYKPENVIIGDKGQVKVLDFGLARAAGKEDSAPVQKPPAFLPASTSGEKLLLTPLTQFGAQIGTIVYMAPEHFLSQELDEKTDQFSFCVTLFEALYGARPFFGKTLDELNKSVTSGCITIPKTADVPKWIENIVLKGLSVSKADRHQSMLELLDVLGDDPERARQKRRKKVLVALMVLLPTIMTIGLGYYTFFQRSKVCTGANRKIEKIWNDEQMTKTGKAFARTGLSYANQTFVRVSKSLDEHLKKWGNEYTETCQATRIRAEQSEEIMDLKLECLNKTLINAGALIKVFAEADKTVVKKAVEAVSSLSGFSSCNDIKALRSRIPLPTDELTRNKVEELEQKLALVQALKHAGKYQDGIAAAKNLVVEAKDIEYIPIYAQAQYWLGYLKVKSANYEEAKENLEEAVFLAEESGHETIKAKALVTLLWVVGYSLARFDEAIKLNRWIRAVAIHLDRWEIRSNWIMNLGVVFLKKGDSAAAVDYFKQALEEYVSANRPNHLSVAAIYNNLGLAYFKLGHIQEAQKYYQEALAIWRVKLGDKHPQLAIGHYNLGDALYALKRFDAAIEHLALSLAIDMEALGSHSLIVAETHHNLARAYWEKGEQVLALANFRQEQRITETVRGRDHPDLVEPLSWLGAILVDQGKSKQAQKLLERVLDLCKNRTCAFEPYARALFGLAKALLATDGNQQRAIKLAMKARTQYQKTPTSSPKRLAEVNAWIEANNKGKR